MIGGRGRGIARATCLTALAAAATGCGSTSPARPSSTAVSVPALPLNTSIATTAGTWATVVMGGSAAQYNDFWQLFIRTAGTTQWKLVTPAGTADNGGLVLAGGTGQDLITAFRPSHDLTYTPLARTSDGGLTWSALGPLDAALASTPGSLAAASGTGRLLALLGTGTAEQAGDTGASWTTLVTAHALATAPVGRSCGLRALTAVAYTPAGTPLLGGSCSRPGSVGIFAPAGGTWQAAGPSLTGALAGLPITVLRLATAGDQITALLGAGTGHSPTTMLAAWSADGGARWTLSPPLTTSGQAITAASFGPGQAAALITADGRGAVLTGARWQQLPALPAGTAALAVGSGATDALAVHQSTLTVWQLTSAAGRWTKEQTIKVAIQYGSSG
jgi:hypothetical protein